MYYKKLQKNCSKIHLYEKIGEKGHVFPLKSNCVGSLYLVCSLM
jgi:hypothetical protein